MNLDLTDVVTDPIFQDETGTLFLRRVLDGVSDQGLATEQTKTVPLQGSVQAGGGARMMRDIESGEMVQDQITIYTTTILRPGRGDRTADVVIYQGKEYVVDSVQDWSNWGNGFVSASCSLLGVRP